MTTAETAPDHQTTAHQIWIGVAVGTGAYRDYGLRSAAGESGLSYSMAPVVSAALTFEWSPAPTPIGIRLVGAFRPVAFDVTINDESTSPSGYLIDSRAFVDYRFRLTDHLELRPQVGLRFGRVAVDEQTPAIVLSSTTLAPVAGVAMAFGRVGGLQGTLAVDAGYVVLFDEQPTTTGDAAGGLALGGDLGMRLWLGTAWALTADARVTYDRIDLSGTPTRVVLTEEAGAFEDPSLSIIDVAFRMGVLLSL